MFDNIVSNFSFASKQLLCIGNKVWVGEIIDGRLYETAIGKITGLNEYVVIVNDEDTGQYIPCFIETSIINPYEFGATFCNDFYGYSDQDIIDMLRAGAGGSVIINEKPNTDEDDEDDID